MSLFDNYSPQADYVEEIPVAPFQKPEVVKGTKPTEPVEQKPILRFAGLDMAKRVDHSALEVLRLHNEPRVEVPYLREEAFALWPHVKYRVVAADTNKVYEHYPWEKLGFDRLGVGDAASEFFDLSGLAMEPINPTMTMKIDIVKIIRGLFETKRLFIGKESELVRQIEEQEVLISQAGNETYKHPVNRHDDRFWALGFACYVALPYVVGAVEPIIRRIGLQPETPDVDAMIDQMMGFDSQIMQI